MGVQSVSSIICDVSVWFYDPILRFSVHFIRNKKNSMDAKKHFETFLAIVDPNIKK